MKKHLFASAVLFVLLTGATFAAENVTVDSGATAWMLTSALVLLMVPGLAMFYGGLVRAKNVIGTMMHSFAAMGIMAVLWVILGYSMSFGRSVLGGWFGFNAVSSVSSGLSTAQALTAMQIAAAAGAISWMLIENLHHGRATALGFASGILAGLAAVTPAAGVVLPMGAPTLGVLASGLCYVAIIIKNKLGCDDSLDAFGVHGVGSITGAVFLTFFIRKSWMEQAAIQAGSSWSLWQQLGVQVTAVMIAIAYAALLTFLLVLLVDKTVGPRIAEQREMAGLDLSYHGKHGYGLLNAN